jgi:hypothetical protein
MGWRRRRARRSGALGVIRVSRIVVGGIVFRGEGGFESY